LLSHGQLFSPGTPASSTTKTGRHDIAEILLKVALSIINQIKSNQINQSNQFTWQKKYYWTPEKKYVTVGCLILISL
jgi:hypothetical protein